VIAGEVIDAVGGGDTLRILTEIVRVDVGRLGAPAATGVFEVAD
jgi:hypothetical protein